MHIWSQVTALLLSGMAFVLALWPRRYSGELTDRAEYRLQPWPRLRRFPLFWLGLALLACLGVQAFNPSWVWTRNATTWWLVRVNDVPWLPTSIEAPFDRFNPWRQFIIYATVWLSSCAVWVGLTRRKSARILLGAMVMNAMLVAVVGLVHKASGAAKLLWLRGFPDAVSFASFVYRNHAGAYFGLMAFAALGLTGWHFFTGQRRAARSTPAPLWLLGTALLVFAVVYSLSRGAILSVTVFGLAASGALLALRFTNATRSTTPALVNIATFSVILISLGFIVRELDFSAVHTRFLEIYRHGAGDSALVGRAAAREAAEEMLADHWLRGVGAGGFRHLFPEYLKGYPDIYRDGRYFWEHAHNDWLEIPVELGLPGVLLLALAGAWAVRAWLKQRGWRHPVALMVAFGLGQVLLHACMDFPLQCPAILVTWAVLLVLSLRWLELDPPMMARENQGEARYT
jgi:O-antigen ligase